MLAQAPAFTMPVEIGNGRSPNGAGGATLRFSSSRRRDARTLSSRSTVLTPSPASEPWVARPRSSSRNVSAPALAATIWPAVGSAMRQASPVWPLAEGAERADAAVLLADDGVHGERSAEPVADGAHGGEDRHDAALHVADAAAVPLVVDLVQVPRVGAGPPLVLARRHDVDVAVEDQRGRALAGDADAAPRLLALDLLARVVGIGAQGVEVEAPQVDVEPEALERRGAPALHRDLGLAAARRSRS